MATRARPLPIILSRDEYRQLDALAREQERDPVQQARFMLRQALRSDLDREPAPATVDDNGTTNAPAH